MGPNTHAAVPIRQGDEQYELYVAALTADHGEVIRGYTYRYERERLSLFVYRSGSWCQPFVEDRARIKWTVIGGAAPFTISIGNRLGFETEQRHGSTVVECVWSEDGSHANLTASVLDAHGDSAADTVDLSQSPNHWAEGSSDPGIALGIRSVHRDRVLLSWTCNHSTNRAALRWRTAGAPPARRTGRMSPICQDPGRQTGRVAECWAACNRRAHMSTSWPGSIRMQTRDDRSSFVGRRRRP